MKKHTVSATEFRAKCLAYLDEIEQNGGSITITRRGRPVAGKIKIVGDIVNIDTSGLWEVARKRRPRTPDR